MSELLKTGTVVKDVRLMRSKETGLFLIASSAFFLPVDVPCVIKMFLVISYIFSKKCAF